MIRIRTAASFLTVPAFILTTALTGASLGAQEATYRIRIDERHPRILTVSATIPMRDGLLRLGQGHPQPEGSTWDDHLTDLEISDPNGQQLAWSQPAPNRWQVESGAAQVVAVKYTLRLDHDSHNWPPSVAEATYARPDASYFRTFAVLLASPEITSGRIFLDIPTSWEATSPLEFGESSRNERIAVSRRQLFDTAFMIGRHQTAEIRVGELALDLGVTSDLPGALDEMVEPFTEALEEADNIFGGVPAGQYAILASAYQQPGFSGTGLGNGMAVLLGTNPTQDPGGLWSYVLVHELLHMWLGSRIGNRSDRGVEWLTEGFSDYLTMVIAGRQEITRKPVVLSYMGTMFGGYEALAGDKSLSDAGDEKRKYYNFIYGGGLHVGLLLDIEIRKASNGSRSIDNLMQALEREFGATDIEVSTADVRRLASDVAATDLSWVFDRFVSGTETLDANSLYRSIGILVIDSGRQGPGRYTLRIDPGASDQSKQLRMAILGW